MFICLFQTNILTQPQTRMEYTHFETSETFEPITGKRKISPPTFNLVSLFAPNTRFFLEPSYIING